MFRAGIETKVTPKDTPRTIVKLLMAERRLYTMLYLRYGHFPNLQASFLANKNKLNAEDILPFSCKLPTSIHNEHMIPNEKVVFIAPTDHTQFAPQIFNELPSLLNDFLK